MKKIIFVFLLVLATGKLNAQPDVLFILPSEPTVIASRVYNLFKEYYRGNTYWEYEKNVSNHTINNNNYIIQIWEESNEYGFLSLKLKTYFGNSSGNRSSMKYSTNFDKLSIYKIQVLEVAFNLIKELDPDYFEELREVFEELGEEH